MELATPPLLLASASPRRLELLRAMGLDALVAPADIDETALPDEQADALVLRLARAKADAGHARLQRSADRAGLPAYHDAAVLAADTVVVCGPHVFGKPRDRADAGRMLAELSGRSHVVMTAVALAWRERRDALLSRTEVWFRRIEAAEAEAYWATGEPRDKAGAYGIQGIGGIFVARIDGSYSGVMGLPIAETEALLGRAGIATWALRAAR